MDDDGFSDLAARFWHPVARAVDVAPGQVVRATLLDRDSKVGKLYGAVTTPHMYVIDPNGTLVYAGAIDDKRSTNVADVKTAKNFVRVALEESIAGKPVSTASTTPYGCTVKY